MRASQIVLPVLARVDVRVGEVVITLIVWVAASLKNLAPLHEEKVCSPDCSLQEKEFYKTRTLAKAPLWVVLAEVIDVLGMG
jgi:hypothetical protein